MRAAAVALALAGCAGAGPPAWPERFAPPPLARATAAAPEAGPLALSPAEAVMMALEGNRAFAVSRFAPARAATAVDEARAVFDPTVTGALDGTRTRTERLARTGAGTEGSRADTIRGSGGGTLLLPTGTEVAATGSTSVTDSSLYADALWSHRLGITVTQALLRGLSPAANLAALRQAELDVAASAYELRGVAEALAADTETTYWDVVLAGRRIAIFEASLQLAEQQVRETDERVRVGALGEIELSAARTEVALRREELIDARSELATVRLRLFRLLGRPPAEWGRDLRLVPVPAVPPLALDDEAAHVQVARRWRPELNQARLAVQRQDLEVVKTRDGLLPKLDVFVTLGKSGYANAFGRAWEDFDGRNYDLAAGLAFEWPAGNRGPRAVARRAGLDRAEAEAALQNLEELVELDVRTAWIEVRRTHEQVAATAATRALQAETLAAETEKFRVGRSTAFLVAQAQRDLTERRIAEAEAVVRHLQAAIGLQRLEGSLLERRGIDAPGKAAAQAPR